MNKQTSLRGDSLSLLFDFFRCRLRTVARLMSSPVVCALFLYAYRIHTQVDFQQSRGTSMDGSGERERDPVKRILRNHREKLWQLITGEKKLYEVKKYAIAEGRATGIF